MTELAAGETRVTCTHDCPDACSALVTVESGRAVAISADRSHPVTGRHLCSKVDRYLERVYDPGRITTPLRRTGRKGTGSFEPISWDEALDEIVSRWSAIIDGSGPEAILPYSYLGNMGVLSAFGPSHALFNRMGASQLHRAICGGQAIAIGQEMGLIQADPEEVVHAELIICWGIDVVSTSIHMWDLIRKARKNGARLIVIDPYRSATAARADVHLPIHPGTDGALALGMAAIMIDRGLIDESYVSSHTAGIDGYRAEVASWTPERTADITGLSVDQIEELAEGYAQASPAAIRFGVGMQRSAGAGMAVRAIQCLPALAGHWRQRGGGIVNSRTLTRLGLEKLVGPGPGSSRTFNMIQLGAALTDPSLQPPVQALFVWNANPAVIAGDQNRILGGLEREDLFTVVHDLFITDTARYADIVLPAPSMIEQDDLVGSWGFNYVSINRAAIEPIGEARSNTEVARLLAARLGYDDPVFTMSDQQLMQDCLDGSDAERHGASYEALQAEGFIKLDHPGGDVPFAEGAFPESPDGRFQFSSERFDAAFGLGAVPRFIEPAESPDSDPRLADRYPLRLLTLKRPHSINSSYGDLPIMRGAEPELRIEIHPEDAAARAITDGDPVAAVNDRGRVAGRALVTDAVTSGTVVVPFGRWLDGGQGANALTSDRLADIGGGPTFCDALVEVERAPIG